MRYLNPKGPIAELRTEMIGLVDDLCACSTTTAEDRKFLLTEVVPLLMTDDDYVRHQAKSMKKLAEKAGIPVEITRH